MADSEDSEDEALVEEAQPDSGPPGFAFEGSGLEVLPLHLVRLVILGCLCLLLPFGVGQAAVLEVRAFLAPLGLGGAWQSVEEALLVLPLISTGFVVLLLLALWGTTRSWLERYRMRKTTFRGAPLEHRGSCNPVPSWIASCLVALTLGLAAPWVFTWRKRGQYAGWHTEHGPLVFNGSAVRIAKYGLFSLLAFPLVVVTFGLASIPIRYLWLRWELSNLGVPDAEGALHPTCFTGSLLGYLRVGVKRWILAVLSLGLHYPWGLVASWRWTAAHITISSEPQA